MGIQLPRWIRSAATQDYAKTQLYSWTDLIVKAVSSVALVTLGIIGWNLQSTTAKNQKKLQDLDLLHRQYVPMLRSLMEMELALDEDEFWLRTTAMDDDPRIAKELYLRGTALRYRAYALFVPDGDPLVDIHRHVLRGDRGANVPVKLPLRVSAIMLSDVMRTQFTLRQLPNQTLRFDNPRSSLIAMPKSGGAFRIRLSPEALDAWHVWLESSTAAPVGTLTPNMVTILLLQDVRFAVAQAGYDVVRKYPDLGADYVTVRAELLHSQRFFNGTLPRTPEAKPAG